MTPASPSHLKGLDYSVVQQCMHCGLCLPTCPTYDATKIERHSPRGRISLMRAIADGRLDATKTFADEMYFCLGCLACMTACPAGVNYAELFEHARAEAEASGVLKIAEAEPHPRLRHPLAVHGPEPSAARGPRHPVLPAARLANAHPPQRRAEAPAQTPARAGSHHARHPAQVLRRADRARHARRRAEEVSRRHAHRLRAGPDLQRHQPRHRRSARAQRLRSHHAARAALLRLAARAQRRMGNGAGSSRASSSSSSRRTSSTPSSPTPAAAARTSSTTTSCWPTIRLIATAPSCGTRR